jgi:hypothetical protein
MTFRSAANLLVLLAIALISAFDIVESFTVDFRTFRPNTKIWTSSNDDEMTRRHLMAAASFTLLRPPQVAISAYGDSSKLKGFDYIEFLMEKNAVADPSTFVYQGADRETQLQRLSSASAALQQIPSIAQQRKWSQVNGVLLGPLGTLIQTMNQIVAGTDLARTDFGSAPPPVNNKEAKAASLKVKADLYAIGQAASKKNEQECIRATEVALDDLQAFVKVAF